MVPQLACLYQTTGRKPGCNDALTAAGQDAGTIMKVIRAARRMAVSMAFGSTYPLEDAIISSSNGSETIAAPCEPVTGAYLKRQLIAISRAGLNAYYQLCCSTISRRDEVLFLSRQADNPSYDFKALAKEFESHGWKTHMHLKKVSKRNFPSYFGHVMREIELIARCRIVILDRYDPIISLLDFKYESESGLPVDHDGSLHTEFPIEPIVFQIWHAFGAFKKFGYQSIGTREGHSHEVIDTFNIHRNYSLIACSSKGCQKAFAEAFSYPMDRVIPLNRPEYSELLTLRDRQTASDEDKGHRPTILFAPTLRKSKNSPHPFRDLYEQREKKLAGLDADIIWSFHPLEDDLPAPGNVSQALLEADYIITDYSSLVYEAYLLGKKVLFYVSDLERYRKSPGLNADPEKLAPGLCIHDEDELLQVLSKLTDAEKPYPFEELARFACDAFDEDTMDMCEFIKNCVS